MSVRVKLPTGNSFHNNNNQEGIHAIIFVFSNRERPASIRNIDSYSNYTYRLVKEDGTFVYMKFHFKTNQGIKMFSEAEANKIAGENPDYRAHDFTRPSKEESTLLGLYAFRS